MSSLAHAHTHANVPSIALPDGAPSAPLISLAPLRPRIALIVPCHNEEAAVAKVVTDLRRAVPAGTVYVYDNASTDATSLVAARAGAVVRYESLKGKGNVVRRALADIDADVYLLIDGDDTYDAAMAPVLIDALLAGPYDLVTGVRESQDPAAFRAGHEMGNRMFNLVIGRIFGRRVRDVLSGYRVFSRRFVRSFPASSRAFEIETELTIHAINNRVPSIEVPVGYRSRPEGSESKLHTYRDGLGILGTIVRLLHRERPLLVWWVLSILFSLGMLAFGGPMLVSFARTGFVDHLPSALLTAVLGTFAVWSALLGLVLDGLRKLRQTQTRLAYLNCPALHGSKYGEGSTEWPPIRVVGTGTTNLTTHPTTA